MHAIKNRKIIIYFIYIRRTDYFMNVKIIAISGKAGSGKTTIAKFLSIFLKATIVAWDDFNNISTKQKNSIDRQFDDDKLEQVLWALKNLTATKHPLLNTKLIPTRYIVLDTPLGRLHKQTDKYIDYCFYIDLPDDILLSRRNQAEAEPKKINCTSALKPFFSDSSLKSSSDFIINGTLSISAQVLAIKHYLSYHWYNANDYENAI